MRLEPGQRAVIGSFVESSQARRAAEALRRAGFESVQVDRISLYPGEGPHRPTQPLTGRIESLSELTMGSASGDTGAALSAHPAASGLAGGPSTRLAPYIVTAVVPESRADEAARILQHHGGVV